ncbi:MAG: sodium ion-translocating decarboxylase subunit beta [Clostridia bacterium]|nr:sodium ion-translocating decarboxylase subunit beta [Clostridia bacterium]
MVEALGDFVLSTGFAALTWKHVIMLVVSCVMMYLAIVKKYEPMLLLPISFGMLLANLPMTGLSAPPIGSTPGGLLYYLNLGTKLGIYPMLVFFGIGAMTDFGPLIANPKTILLGAAAQAGIFITFIAALLVGFRPLEAASIGVIGAADGPTAIYVTSRFAPHMLAQVAVAAYSYMSLVPIIMPPVMRALTTKRERVIKMKQLRPVSKTEKIIFPIIVTVLMGLILPSGAGLIGSLMIGNLIKESGVVDRLSKTVQNELASIVTIFLGLTVGASATAEAFLNVQTLGILALGLLAFSGGIGVGVLVGKLMCWLSGGKVNPLIGAAGISAVPMAARVVQVVGQEEDPNNYLLMHAMGANVGGQIASTIAAGVILTLFSKPDMASKLTLMISAAFRAL